MRHREYSFDMPVTRANGCFILLKQLGSKFNSAPVSGLRLDQMPVAHQETLDCSEGCERQETKSGLIRNFETRQARES